MLVDGSHGQSGAEYALSVEDMAWYGRYLEGVSIQLSQRNDLTDADLSDYRAVLTTAAPESFTAAEIAALRSFSPSRTGTVGRYGRSPTPSSGGRRRSTVPACRSCRTSSGTKPSTTAPC